MTQKEWLIAFDLSCAAFLVVWCVCQVIRIVRNRRRVKEFKRTWLDK